MQEAIKLVIVLDGGVIQNIMTCGIPIDVAVIDYDAEGNDAEDIVQIPQDGEGSACEPAILSRWQVSGSDPAENAAAFDLHSRVIKHCP